MRLYEFDSKRSKLFLLIVKQLVTIEVGKRIDALKDKPAYTPVILNTKILRVWNDGFEARMVSSCWGKGIIDAEIQVVSISGTVKFKVLENDTKDPLLEAADILYKPQLDQLSRIHSLFQMQMAFMN
jgi:hypothetical protein